MHIVIAAATPAELKPFLTWQSLPENNQVNKIQVLITGVGVLPATFSLTRKLMESKPDLVIQAGIAGSYDAALTPGSVILVNEEIVGDYGVMENGEWKDIFELGLMKKNGFPFSNGRLVNPHIHNLNHSGLPTATSLTVNELITFPEKLSAIRKKYNPQIESMEGAALHYTCLQLKIPFLQVRGISNEAAERNKNKWKIEEAIAQLNTVLINLIEQTGK